MQMQKSKSWVCQGDAALLEALDGDGFTTLRVYGTLTSSKMRLPIAMTLLLAAVTHVASTQIFPPTDAVLQVPQDPQCGPRGEGDRTCGAEACLSGILRGLLELGAKTSGSLLLSSMVVH